ncbi:ParA family protein [Rhodoplanes sp. TEM]|uniref:ParA family protein n=1 Tax=Rhodoplanes tepidamans TaxID=200616 RepID=A0ABT5JIU4_RHOTP|nr:MULTISPECIES: ParA family protein [Rhodoplanes]MDC7789522.1 ParA family protein [Rhodoplanes tepidamans]MDC7987926.1 ParA family protein [Rhodoplanes sp. TEM]MDQ0359101.1 chromosome partitioning protein [Rhodoplanes tepidamans]
MAGKPHVIAFVQGKGGVGKTTIAVSVAAELKKRGAMLGLVDADPQGSACSWAETGKLAFPVWRLPLDERPVTTWVAQLGRVPGRVVLIDSAPNDRALGACVAVADTVMVPCGPSGLDLDATFRTIGIIEEVRRRRQTSMRVILIPNRVDLRTLEGQQISEELKTAGEIVSAPVGNRTAFVRAFTTGHAVNQFAPGSPADRDIQVLCNTLETVIRAAPRHARPA